MRKISLFCNMNKSLALNHEERYEIFNENYAKVGDWRSFPAIGPICHGAEALRRLNFPARKPSFLRRMLDAIGLWDVTDFSVKW